MHYYSNIQKYNNTQWHFYSKITDLTPETYIYYALANDTAGNEDTTETRYYNYFCCGCGTGTYNYTCRETIHESCTMNCNLPKFYPDFMHYTRFPGNFI